MVIYKKTKDKIYLVNARIDAIGYKNQIKGERISACISYSVNGRPYSEWVDFWNAKIKTKPQLYTSFVNTCKVGDILLILLKGNDNNFNSFVLKFVREGNAMKIEDRIIYFGPVEKKEINTQIGPITSVAIKTPTKNIAMRIASWNVPSEKFNIANGNNYIVIAHAPEEELTPDGRRVMRYIGDTMYKNNDIPVLRKPNGDIVIDIGCYANHPQELKSLLSDKTESDLQKILLWMHYVADEWQPVDDPRLTTQKAAISEYLHAYESAMQAQ